MADKSTKLPRLTTPKGVAKYPWLNKPDTQFNAEGVYKINLLIPAAEAATLCTQLDKLADEAVEKAKAAAKNPALAKSIKRADPYSLEVDNDGDETGNVEFRFKMNARVRFKDGTVKNLKPYIFDAKGKQLPVCPAVYGGSVCRVNFSPAPYYAANNKQAGISLRINAVQIIELVTGGGGTASGYGFAAEEGFDGDDLSLPASMESTPGTTTESADF